MHTSGYGMASVLATVSARCFASQKPAFYYLLTHVAHHLRSNESALAKLNTPPGQAGILIIRTTWFILDTHTTVGEFDSILVAKLPPSCRTDHVFWRKFANQGVQIRNIEGFHVLDVTTDTNAHRYHFDFIALGQRTATRQSIRQHWLSLRCSTPPPVLRGKNPSESCANTSYSRYFWCSCGLDSQCWYLSPAYVCTFSSMCKNASPWSRQGSAKREDFIRNSKPNAGV